MARTRKSIQPLNLHTYDVLIEDRGVRSDYFKISQFDGYFYGGRNAFLLAGANVLKPNSKILVEILNKDNETVYSAPVSSFIEGNSRLIQIEVYSDTPIGPGKIVILGSADYYMDGTPIPPEWKNKYNVRWITDVIISPLVENKTPIRFVNAPSVQVVEKFYTTISSASFSSSINVPVDVKIYPKNYNVFPNGYLLELVGPANTRYLSDYLGGVLTGSISFTSASVQESASINLPITRIYNSRLAESNGALIYSNNKTLLLDGTISSSGTYNTTLNPYGTVNATSTLNLLYNKIFISSFGSPASYVRLRVVDLKTISGEIHKIKVSYKSETDPGEYILLSDVSTTVQELLAIDSGSIVAQTGNFGNINLNQNWYSATMSLQKNEVNPILPIYYTTSSALVTPLVKTSADLLDSINATPSIVNNKFIDNVSYFIGTKEANTIELFPRTEYTLAFDAFVNRTTGSVDLIQDDYSLEVYLVPASGSSTKILDDNPRGQLLGTLNPRANFQRQNFETVEFNFTPKIFQSGKYGLRFIVYGGSWSIANASVKPAQEPFFSPDEIDVLVPVIDYDQSVLTFKLEYLDVDNNSAGISTFSIPTYFQGRSSVGSLNGGTINYLPIWTATNALSSSAIYQSNGNVGIRTTSPGATLHVQGNISASSFTGSFSGLVTSASVAATASGLLGGTTNYIPLWTSGTQQSSSAIFQNGGNIGIGTTPSHKFDVRLPQYGTANFESTISGYIVLRMADPNQTILRMNAGANTFQIVANAGSADVSINNQANSALVFSTNNSERVRITSTGTVGIGTTSPGATLHVQGNVSASSYTGSFSGLITSASVAATASGLLGGTANYIPLWTSGTAQSSSAIFQSAGLIGIGTTTPTTANVHINSTVSLPLRVSSDTNFVEIRFSSSSVGTGRDHILRHRTNAPTIEWVTPTLAGEVATWRFLPVDDSNYGISIFSPRNVGATARLQSGLTHSLGIGANGVADVIWVTGSGNVGIGTTSPSERLRVNGTFASNALWTTSTAVAHWGSYPTIKGVLTWDTNWARVYAATGNRLDLGADGNNAHLTITSSGNVGIGTTAPGATLHVQGNVSASSYTGSFLSTNGLVSSSTQIDVRNTIGIATIATTGSNAFTGAQTITGSVIITQNLTVFGSSSISFVSQSTLNIGTNLITVNVQSPSVRFGGLAVIDSGSAPQRSGSLLFDSVNDQWIFIHQNLVGGVTSSILVMGPPTFNNVGNETLLTQNRLLKGGGLEHIVESQITDDGSVVSITNSLNVGTSITASSGNITTLRSTSVTASVSGALTGTFPYPSLTSIPTGIISSSTQINALSGVSASFATIANQLNGGTTGYIPLWSSATVQSSSALFQNGGNIGIRVTNPDVAAHIGYGTLTTINTSDIRTITALGLSGDDPGTTSANHAVGLTFRPIRGRGAVASIVVFNDGANKEGTGEIAFYNGSGAYPSTVTERMRIRNNGNVGIGVSSPDSLLHVKSTSPVVRIDSSNPASNSELKLTYNTDDNHGLILRYLGNSAVSFIDNSYPATVGQQYGDIQFRQNVSSSLSARMIIKADGGNVGIGTTTPGARLDVVNTTGAVTSRVRSTFSNAYFIIDRQDTSSEGFLRFATNTSNIWTIGLKDSTNTLYFNSGIDRVVIDSSGRVGVGTTTPGTTLHVQGNISASVFTGSAVYVSSSLGELLPLTSASLTTGDFFYDTNITISNLSSYGPSIYELLAQYNNNSSGSSTYRNIIHGHIYVEQGWDGSQLVTSVEYNELFNAVASGSGAGANVNVSFVSASNASVGLEHITVPFASGSWQMRIRFSNNQVPPAAPLYRYVRLLRRL